MRASTLGHRRGLLLGFLLSLAGCSGEEPIEPEHIPGIGNPSQAESLEGDPRQPRVAVVEALRADIAATRHPSDGGGEAWIEVIDQDHEVADFSAVPSLGAAPEREPLLLQVDRPVRLGIVYRAGPLGIADGGTLFLQISPFWGWSTPQTQQPDAPGYTTVDSALDGLELKPETIDRQLLAVGIRGRALLPGEEIRLTYGAGRAAAAGDRFAETAEHIWLAVDGDGDGIRELLAQPPRVDIRAGSPALLSAILPSTAKPGQPVRLHLAVLDRLGNAGLPFVGQLRLQGSLPFDLRPGPGIAGKTITFGAGDRGSREVELSAASAGVLRLQVEGPEGLRTRSNPLLIAPAPLGVYWADLQTHSNFSDGTGLPEELYAYGRDVAGLDVMSVTDHDHWGMRFLDAGSIEGEAERGAADVGGMAAWEHIQAVTETFHQPGRFVTIRGYEWTNWVHGHRHVLLFDEGEFPLRSSIDPDFDHPEELWQALRGRRALTIAHHSAGGPIATDWRIAPDPELETVTEVVSVHGSSEAADSPRPIYDAVDGNFVRDGALGRGYRLGFLGSTDGHDGHPGLGHLASPSGGLAAILAEELDRDSIYRALLERRVYATSGPRILLRAVYGGYRMGAAIPLDNGAAAQGPGREVEMIPTDHLFVQVHGTANLSRLDIVRTGEIVVSLPCDALECDGSEMTVLLPIEDLKAGEWLYVRAVQEDGHFALSSPFFFDD